MCAVKNPLPFPTENLTVAQRLAFSRHAVNPSMTDIYLIRTSNERSPKETITLLEVNSNATASGIMPVLFAAHSLPSRSSSVGDTRLIVMSLGGCHAWLVIKSV